MKDFFQNFFFFLGRMAAWFKWNFESNSHEAIICLFPVATTGGAEIVHLNILNNLNFKRLFIIFEFSREPDLLDRFKKLGTCYFADNFQKWPRFQSFKKKYNEGFFSGLINSNKKNIVFTTHGNLLTRLEKHINREIKVIDIIHNSIENKGLAEEYLKIQLANRFSKRIIISQAVLNEVEVLYNKYGFSTESMILLENYTDFIEENYVQKNFTKYPLNITYIGRDVPEKRINIALKVAQKADLKFWKFNFVGNFKTSIGEENIHFIGLVQDRNKLKKILEESHFLILTSSSEGFPMVIAEAMAVGTIPLTTDVGGIPFHIKDGQNGFLIPFSKDPVLQEKAFLEKINELRSTNDLESISKDCYLYAKEHFSSLNYSKKLQQIFYN